MAAVIKEVLGAKKLKYDEPKGAAPDTTTLQRIVTALASQYKPDAFKMFNDIMSPFGSYGVPLGCTLAYQQKLVPAAYVKNHEYVKEKKSKDANVTTIVNRAYSVAKHNVTSCVDPEFGLQFVYPNDPFKKKEDLNVPKRKSAQNIFELLKRLAIVVHGLAQSDHALRDTAGVLKTLGIEGYDNTGDVDNVLRVATFMDMLQDARDGLLK